MLVTQKDTTTKIKGIITPKSINNLKNELGGAFTTLKSNHFTEGQCYVILASVIPQEKYQIVITNPDWVYADVISTSVKEMTMAAGARMWECEMFIKDLMVAWEDKLAAKQTWQALQDYFTEKWLECCQYSQATAKHLRFKDAALTAQKHAAAETKGKASVMIFALLQEQNKNWMEAMATASQKAMDAMMERMNALVAGHGKPLDKENTMHATGNASSSTGGRKRNKKKCTNCGKHVFHKPVDCYKLEANSSKC